MVAVPAQRARVVIAAVLAVSVVGACSGGEPVADPAGTSSSARSPTSSPTSAVGSTATEEPSPTLPAFEPEMQIYDLPAGSGPHDVAPATDGGVW